MKASRRKMLALLGVGSLTGIAGCEQLPIGEEQTRPTDEPQARPDDPATPHDHVGEQWSGQLASGDGLTMANTATSGAGRGIVGSTAAPEGAGVAGVATDTSGENDGVVGRSDSDRGTGVLGHATAGSGETRGVVGQADSPDGYGLFTPDDAGVEGFLDVGTLGTARGRPVSVRAGGARALELGPETTGAAGNLIAGHPTNAVAASVNGATIGGGGFDDGETAAPNRVLDDFGTVGGGRGNQAGSKDDDPRPAVHATVGGGAANVADGDAATVGGGEENVASAGTTTVGGGTENVASTFHATVGGGGAGNLADGAVSTISGGAWNEAPGSRATVGGGHTNAATGAHSTIVGGRFNTAEGDRSVVAGGSHNVAEGRSSFAAGRRARAYHDGAVVWSDSSTDSFASTGEDQFLIQAGSVGIGTNAPVSQLHVVDDPSAFASLDNHVMTVENHSSESSTDVLALKTHTSDPSGESNFVTFLDAAGFVGSIEGNGSGGVSYRSGAADVAEYFSRADPDETFAPGDVVGLRAGAVVADPTAAEEALVVSDAPMVTGNVPADGEEAAACVALLGQVPVRVGAPVEAGDLLVATADGTAVPASDATAVSEADAGGGPVVGRALEGAEAAGDLVRTFVSVGAGDDPRRTEEHRDGRFDSMETEMEQLRVELVERDERIDALEDENEALRERLGDLEERVATVEHAATAAPDGSSPPAPADGRRGASERRTRNSTGTSSEPGVATGHGVLPPEDRSVATRRRWMKDEW